MLKVTPKGYVQKQNQDVQGDLYEYLLSHLSIAGRTSSPRAASGNGQFRTPRHIIRMMVQMLDPKPKERTLAPGASAGVGDLAAGTGGFLINAHQHILEKATSKDILEYDADGMAHHLIGDGLQDDARKFMKGKKYLRGFDNDSGMTMLRIGSMNLMLHGIQSPQFFYMDTLSKGYDGAGEFDVILMNPPFKGAVDKGDVHPDLPSDTTKSELLFLHLILRALDMGGRAAVIVPDGVLFGSSRAHVEVRKRIIEENRLDGVVSMPSGVFKPYAGVSTAVLFFTRGAQTKDIWFYDMEHDGFSLDDKRTKVDASQNDIPDILECWKNRLKPDFQSARAKRIADLRRQLTPLKAERLQLQAEINRLQFESVLTPSALSGTSPKSDMETLNNNQNTSVVFGGGREGAALAQAQAKLTDLQSQISNPQSELDRLTRQFWVTKEQVRANKYDLSASRYRQVDADLAYHEKPSVTLERLARLESVVLDEIYELRMFFEGNAKKTSEGWEFDILENLAERIDYGVTASANLNPVGPKFLRITDIQDGTVNWDEVPYCEITEKEQKQSLLEVGDIVFARTGATTGKSFLIKSCPENSVFASYLIRVRPGNRINPSYLFGYFQTDAYWKQITESATGSTQPGVNSTKLGQLKIPVPPLAEQERFARLLTYYERIRKKKAETDRQVMELFQSILGDAF